MKLGHFIHLATFCTWPRSAHGHSLNLAIYSGIRYTVYPNTKKVGYLNDKFSHYCTWQLLPLGCLVAWPLIAFWPFIQLVTFDLKVSRQILLLLHLATYCLLSILDQFRPKCCSAPKEKCDREIRMAKRYFTLFNIL